MLRSTLRGILFTVISVIAILAIWAAFAFLLPHVKINRAFTETPGGITIYVCSNGVHTGVCLPVNTQYINWGNQFAPATFKTVDTGFKYIEIGWGDKAFYLYTPTWADLKLRTAYRALFFLDSAAMHVTYDKAPPALSPQFCHKINISGQQYQQLINYIQRSFTMHSGHVALFPGKGYGAFDNFYEANGHYSFLKTCNVWTCGALKAADIEQGFWTPLQGGVMDGYVGNN